MSVVSTTLCYPNPGAPTQGVFIARRLEAIHALMPIRIVAPVPWFPFLKPACDVATKQGCAIAIGSDMLPATRSPVGSRLNGCSIGVGMGSQAAGATHVESLPPVIRPRMFYLPGILKQLDARFYTNAIGKSIDALNVERPIRLIDAHFVWPDGVGAWEVAKERGLPFVCTIRGKIVSQIACRVKRQHIAEMLRCANGLIAVSQSLAELAREVAGADLEINVIPNGVDQRLFHQTSNRNMPSILSDLKATDKDMSSVRSRPSEKRVASKYVVSVGHLQALKGFSRLVELWPAVCGQVGDARLLLVGGEAGEPFYTHRLKALIASVNQRLAPRCQDDAVILLGRQTPERVARLLNAADLFVLASRSEGWSNAMTEALACGCPVVATDVGGNREIVHDPRLGGLVPLTDLDALTQAICGALNCDWNRAYIADVGGQRNWQQVARQCVDVFDNVLECYPAR